MDVQALDTQQSFCKMINAQRPMRVGSRIEHCEAFPTPFGGITIDLSPIGRAHPTRDAISAATSLLLSGVVWTSKLDMHQSCCTINNVQTNKNNVPPPQKRQ